MKIREQYTQSGIFTFSAGILMHDQGPKTEFGNDWDAYWRNAQASDTHKDGGAQDEALERFWLKLFDDVLPALDPAPAMLDIGAGNGAVIRFALNSARNAGQPVPPCLVALDRSAAALVELRKRHAEVACVAADSAHCPFKDQTFDLVTSQFGVEYAGPDAIAEAARLVRPGGTLAAVLHMRDGGIFQECATNLEAIDVVRGCNLLGRFKKAFEAAAPGQRDAEGERLFRDADERFARAVAETEDVFRRLGKNVATGLLFRLYTDIGYMYRRIGAYEPGEVFNWSDAMMQELDSYSGRMASMLEAALAPAQLERAVANIRNSGLEIVLRDTLNIGQSLTPAAWLIIAKSQQGK